MFSVSDNQKQQYATQAINMKLPFDVYETCWLGLSVDDV